MTEHDLVSSRIVSARPRALAALVRYFGDVDLAEDAFQDAALRAMKAWPSAGVPADPVAWLAVAGRNAGLDAVRRARPGRTGNLPPDIAPEDDVERRYAREIELSDYRDDVLRLLFMCCHRELSLQDQLALALKVVGGLTTPQIARAFVVQPKAMEQRLTRAKTRAAAVATALETPSPAERARRLDAVSSMVYVLFSQGYSASGGDEHIRRELCEEAIRIARLLLGLFPGQAEVMGLLALCLLQHSRHRARLEASGRLVSLDQQDRSLWDRDLIAEGLALVEKALRKGRPGRFQIQAAIAAVHCRAARPGETDWSEIDRLYAALERVAGSPIVTLNRAVAVAKIEGPAAALALLAPLEAALGSHLHFYATRGALRAEVGELDGARADFEAALRLQPTEAERAHLTTRLLGLADRPAAVGSGQAPAS